MNMLFHIRESGSVKTLGKLWCFLSIVLCMGGNYLYSMAAEEKESVKVAVVNYPNFFQMNEDGSVNGYAYEYLQDIQQMTGWQYDFIEMNFAEASEALATGKIDLVAGNQYVEERGKFWDYSKRDMGEGGTVLCVRSDDMRYSYNDYSAYDGIKIAGLKGSVRIEQTKAKLAQYGSEAIFMEYKTDEESKKALMEGIVDAVLMSNVRCESQYKILARINSLPMYFCTNKQRPELKEQLDLAMEEIHLEHPYYEEELYRKYYGDIPIQLAFTQKEKEYIAGAEPIVVAVSTDLSPIEYYSEQEKTYKGIVPDSFHILEQYSGLSFQFVPRQDMKTLKKQIETGQVQLIASVEDAPEMASLWKVTLTTPYYNNNGTLVVNRNVGDYKSGDCTVVLRTGYPFFEQTARERGYQNFVYADTFEKCLKMVNTGKADLTLVPSNSINSLTRRYGYEDLNTYTLSNSNSDFCIGVSQYADSSLLPILNKSLASFTQEQQAELLFSNMTAESDVISLRGFFNAYGFDMIMAVFVVMIIISCIILYLFNLRMRDNARLKDALQRADTANHVKSDFMARMSHDMRTPMNGILGLTYLMEDQTEIEEVKKELPKLREAGEYLLQLINDVLDVNRVESGAMELHPKTCDAELLFTSIVDMVKLQMEQKSITFRFVKDNVECKYLELDEQRVKQIFVNLLGNAVKFTPDGGEIDFIIEGLSQDEELARFRFLIRDNGIGIAEKFLPRLFEPFAQENRVRTSMQSGTGLGLAIVKKLVELMDGSIYVKSEVDKGTEFTLLLNFPLAKPNGMICAAEEEKPIQMPSGLRILLCEDHPLNAQIAIRLLQKQGAEVIWRENGKLGVEAFEESETGQYDVILMDIRMPVMNGLQATEAIRKLDRKDAESIPIIAMTANVFEEDIQESLEAGMNAHLAKPIDPVKLYQTIADQVTGRTGQ